MIDRDDALLDMLADRLAAPSVEPSPAEVNALRFAVTHPQPEASPRRSWMRRPLVVAAATTAAVLVGSTAVATATTGNVPAPVRSVARVVGITVDDDQDDAPAVTTTTNVTPPTTAAIVPPLTARPDNSGPGSLNSGPGSVDDDVVDDIDDDNSGPGGGGDNSGPGSDDSGRSGKSSDD